MEHGNIWQLIKLRIAICQLEKHVQEILESVTILSLTGEWQKKIPSGVVLFWVIWVFNGEVRKSCCFMGNHQSGEDEKEA